MKLSKHWDVKGPSGPAGRRPMSPQFPIHIKRVEVKSGNVYSEEWLTEMRRPASSPKQPSNPGRPTSAPTAPDKNPPMPPNPPGKK